MSGRSFRSVFMVASCAGAALGCYLVSLRVASERAALEDVETQIVLAQRDIRLLQTEIGTRGRLAQLERWNVKVLALSAPSADQFLNGGFELARLVQPKRKIDIEAPVVLAAAPGDAPKPQVQAQRPADEMPDLSPGALMQTVSLKRDLPAQGSAKLSLSPRKAEASQSEIRGSGLAKKTGEPKAAAASAKAAAAAVKPKAPVPGTSAVAKPAPDKKKPVAADKKVAPPEKKKAAAVDPLAPLKVAPAKPKKLASSSTKESTKRP